MSMPNFVGECLLTGGCGDSDKTDKKPFPRGKRLMHSCRLILAEYLLSALNPSPLAFMRFQLARKS